MPLNRCAPGERRKEKPVLRGPASLEITYCLKGLRGAAEASRTKARHAPRFVVVSIGMGFADRLRGRRVRAVRMGIARLARKLRFEGGRCLYPWGLCFSAALCFIPAPRAAAQDRDRGDEIVANLAGGRVIIDVAQDEVIFAAIDQPMEAHSIPPRVMSIDTGHIGVLFGASEWRLPADPKPVRLDRDFPHITARNPNYQGVPDAGDPDLETIGTAFLERLRPLVTQLHHKIEFKPDEALFEVVLVGFAPDNYGPEVWTIEYRVEQDEIATRGDFWQTRVLRPRFTQLYPPEKHAPKTLVETRYPPDLSKEPTLLQLIQGNDPDIENLSKGEPKFLKVMEGIDGGRANKASARDASDFMRAVLPLIAGNSKFILGTMTDRGFDWVVPPEEPVEKAQEDKNRPPEAPTLRKKPGW